MISIRLVLCLLFSIFSYVAFAQVTIQGSVIDYDTKKGIGDCNVYLSGTSQGTFTNAKGFFEIKNVKDGIHEVVFSHVNYKSFVQVIEVKGKDIGIRSSLVANPISLSSVVVTNQKSRATRRRAMKKFKDFFFGKQYLESRISILNEDIIDLSKENDGVIESKNEYTLQVRNDYLGYDLEYYLKQFRLSDATKLVLGFPKFEAQEADNPTQELDWIENRQRAYNGSLRHFFHALLNQELEEEGFEAYLTRKDPELSEEDEIDFYKKENERRYLIDSKNLPVNITISDTEFENIKQINFGEIFDVNYTKEFARFGGYQNSKIKLVQDYVYVYDNGVVVNPSAIRIFGQWADEGTYQLLPYDYVSNDTLVLNDNAERQARLGQLNAFTESSPVEKVYIHTNRSDYYPDETIWFKAYAVAGPLHQPSPLSHNIYVDLIGPNNRLVKQVLLISKEGFANGSIDLAKNLRAGTYTLQAYTTSMKDSGPEYFFRKEILVNSTSGRKEEVLIASDTDLQFFPESGHMLTNIESQIALKAIDQEGLPKSVRGRVFNGSGQPIANFSTEHDGMGVFPLTPLPGQRYYAQIDGQNKRFDLPTAEERGVILAVDNQAEKEVVFNIRKSAQGQDEGYFLIGHSRGWLNYTASVEFTDNQQTIRVPLSVFPEGINHLTLFNKKGAPLAERLFYNHKNDLLNVSILANKENYKSREKTTLKIKVTDKNGAPVQGNFSLSAFNMNRVYKATPNDHIVSNLLLNSDLKCYLHNPAYYFEDFSPIKKRHLDLVMRTHGWTRFSWDNLEDLTDSRDEPNYQQRYNITGRMFVKGKKKPVKNGTVTYINNASETPETLVATTDKNGTFVIEDAVPYEDTPFLLRGTTARNSDAVRFEVDSVVNTRLAGVKFKEVTFPGISDSPEEDLAFDTGNENTLDEPGVEASGFIVKDNKDYLSTMQVLDPVVIEGEREVLQRQSLYGPPSVSLSLTNIVKNDGRADVIRYLKGRIPGVFITSENLTTTIEIRSITNSGPTIGGTPDDPNAGNDGGGFPPLSNLIQTNPDNPLLFLDNVPVSLEAILTIPATVIERVEVFKGPDAAVFGANGSKGVILFFTKPGVSSLDFIQAEGISAFTVQGYHLEKDFYVPRYDLNYEQTGVPDFRVAIHWEPQITTNELGEAIVAFYNSDDKDIIQVIVEGISNDGTPGIGRFQYNVVNNE